jgi:hypothetical protein
MTLEIIMKYDKHINIINELTDIAEIILRPFDNPREPYKSFGLGNSNITFRGFDKVDKYQDGLESIFNSNKEISETWTLKKFETDFVNLIRILKNENRLCNTADIETLFDKFAKVEIQESEILYELYGAEMNLPKLALGDFTIYDFDLSISELTKRFPYLVHQDIYFSNRKSKYLVGIKVKARDNDKAVEIANSLCESFENIFSYMIADLKHERTIGIFNFRGWRTTSIVVCNQNSMGFQGKNNIVLPVNIADPFFTDPSQGNDKLWTLITKTQKTEIEKRLLNAIEWIGKAVYDFDLSKSLVQFVFAIEGMLQQNEKTIITPSIVSQLSDWLAFIINDDLEQRKKISKYFKDIYQKRSAIAHGAAKTIDIQDLAMALQISKLMIIAFLTHKPFCDIKTMDELNKCMTDLKFK